VVEPVPSPRSAYEFDGYEESQDDGPRKGGKEIRREEDERETLAVVGGQCGDFLRAGGRVTYSEFIIHQAPTQPAMAPLAPREETWNPLLSTQ